MQDKVSEFINVLKPYQEVFEVFYCKDEEVALQYFPVNDFPKQLPFVALVDSFKRTPLREIRNTQDQIPVKKERPLSEGSFIYKTFSVLMPNNIEKQLNQFINQYLDDESSAMYVQEKQK